MDTVKKFCVCALVVKRFRGGKNWVKAWIEAAARELAKTIHTLAR